jgi:hypothetical protein
MDEAMGIRFESVPLHEEIESSQGKGQAHWERCPGPLCHFLQRTAPGQHREHGLHQPPGIPQPTITQFEIRRVALCGVESGITQDHPLVFKGLNQWRKGSIGRMGTSTSPTDHQAQLSKQQTKFATANPALMRFPFAATLLPTPAFAPRVQHFKAITINDSPERGGSQELLRPGPLRGQHTKQPRALRQRREQWPPIAVQPPVKGPIPHSFESKENPQSDNFTRPQVRQGRFGAVEPGFIYPIEHLTDKVLGRQALSSCCGVGVATCSLGSAPDAFQGPLKLAPLVI